MSERRISAVELQTRVESIVAADPGSVVLTCAVLASLPPLLVGGALWLPALRSMALYAPTLLVGGIWMSRTRGLLSANGHAETRWTSRRAVRAVVGAASVLAVYGATNFFAFVVHPGLAIPVFLLSSIYLGPAFAIAADGVSPARALVRNARMPERRLAWLTFHAFVLVAWCLGMVVVWMLALVKAPPLVSIGLACVTHAVCTTALGLALAVITHDHELRTKDNADRVARVF